MASNLSLNLEFFLFIIVSFFIFPTTEADDEVTYFSRFCEDKETTTENTFQVNVKTLLTSLSSNATVRTFYNNTVGGRNASDTVYGLFMCRGDIPSQLCGQCVLTAAQRLSSESDCDLAKKAVIWYYECMVRYSNTLFFSIEETYPGAFMWRSANVSNQASFKPFLDDTVNKTIDEAASSPSGNRNFATKEANVSEDQTLYCLAQCTQDLSPQNCRACLITTAITWIIHQNFFFATLSVASVSPSCNFRYEFYPFYYRINAQGQGQGLGGLLPLAPATKHLDRPGYLSHNCSSSAYDGWEEIEPLLSNLSSKASKGLYDTEFGDTFFSLFMCRGDIPLRLCGQCVSNATKRLVSLCPYNEEATIWYNHCLIRYSNKHDSYRMSTSAGFVDLNVTTVNDVEGSFKFTRLSNALADVALETSFNSDEKYLTKSFILNDNQTLYVLAQCTPDLSRDDCSYCLHDIIGSGIPWSRLASVRGRVLYPSCTLRFELFKFYMNATRINHAPPPTIPPAPSPLLIGAPSPPRIGRKGLPRSIILIIVLTVISVILFSFFCYLLRKKARKSHKIMLKENFGPESTTVESLQFDLAIIKAATNNFSYENRIGRGGFGEVYKGVLLDGRYIAVKRLSKSSKQGVTEFKNEILLIAKLQHRNLVAFIGFCLEEEEKILIYEYVPNKSLDYFLFDAHSDKLLNWFERHKIMEGIAREILYLHEHSRLKVIHRDLKSSNVLLDENMNPKISDFDLARIIEIDQQEGATNKIVGTLGYMSSEYVMLGQFSEKSDIFSLEVMILEIIMGKKNVTSHKSRHFDDGLLSLVWRQFRNQTPLNIVDPKMKEDCHEDEFEVIRCIQIGLLCVQEDPNDRPTMMAVVSYFSNRSIELPSPREPAFFLRHNTDLEIVLQESSSSSINMMPINMMSTTSNLITPR